MKKLLMVAAVLTLCACSGPKDTLIPTDISKLDSIAPQVDKLSAEDKKLLATYIIRHGLSKATGKNGEWIPEGVTIGKAIDEERETEAAKK